jgi:hypothetical protein
LRTLSSTTASIMKYLGRYCSKKQDTSNFRERLGTVVSGDQIECEVHFLRQSEEEYSCRKISRIGQKSAPSKLTAPSSPDSPYWILVVSLTIPAEGTDHLHEECFCFICSRDRYNPWHSSERAPHGFCSFNWEITNADTKARFYCTGDIRTRKVFDSALLLLCHGIEPTT